MRNIDGGFYRFDPRTWKADAHIRYAIINPHGHVFDHWGQEFVTDGTTNVNYYGTAFSGYAAYPRKHPAMDSLFKQNTRPSAGTEIISSRHFPDDMQGDFLITNVIGFQGILHYKLKQQGSGFVGEIAEPILTSSDANFRPVDQEFGPDGALYFLDWQNPIIGHLQHNLRDPSRGRTHGRVYRVTAADRPLAPLAKIAGQPIEALLDLLRDPDYRVRYRTRIELSGRKSDDVAAAITRWTANLDSQDPQYAHHLLEALWVDQHHNIVNVELLERVLASPQPRARALALRVLGDWHDRVPGALALLNRFAADADPLVRLEAVRAASFFTVPEAIEPAAIAAEQPLDYYLNYVRNETLATLEPYYHQAISAGRPIAVTTPVGARLVLQRMNNAELLKADRTVPVLTELLLRSGITDAQRREALTQLAKLQNKPEVPALVGVLQERPASDTDDIVTYDLVRLLTSHSGSEMQAARGELEKLATQSKQPAMRRIGYLGLIAADGSADKAWQLGSGSLAGLLDLVTAAPLIADAGARAALFPKIAPLLDGLPKIGSSDSNAAAHSTRGRFVRISLPRKGTLTLAEVEVYSNGRNIARHGTASQKNVAWNGPPSKGIDGNSSGNFGDKSHTHTEEDTAEPWWEVDLGSEQPIDSIVIYNRTDGDFGKRLDGFTLQVLDARRDEKYRQEKIPAPPIKAEFKLTSVQDNIRRAAMIALVSMRGQEAPAFKLLSRFVRDNVERTPAIKAIQRIPAPSWPADEVAPLLDSILGYVREMSPQERTAPTALDAMQLANALAAALPADQAKKARADLAALGVSVIRVGTIPHQMVFDQEQLIVQAGKPIEIVFENSDIMPHNFAIVEPGALEEVGLLAEATATQPDAPQRHFVPQSKKILLASQLLQPTQSQQMTFKVPTKPGVYPYVCTYPGHWRRMYGAMYVVDNLDEYLANPEAYLAAHPLPVADELLKFNRPRKEWKLEELTPALTEIDHGRSFSNARQLFQVASCVACHKLNDAGNAIGPDLSKLDPKLTPADILKEILQPSAKINEKFQTVTLTLDSGKIISGLIVNETPQAIRVIENPLAKAEPIEIPVSEIETRQKSAVSLMPNGLLDKLTREEVLDLLAYIVARGDEHAPAFHGAGHHH